MNGKKAFLFLGVWVMLILGTVSYLVYAISKSDVGEKITRVVDGAVKSVKGNSESAEDDGGYDVGVKITTDPPRLITGILAKREAGGDLGYYPKLYRDLNPGEVIQAIYWKKFATPGKSLITDSDPGIICVNVVVQFLDRPLMQEEYCEEANKIRETTEEPKLLPEKRNPLVAP